MFALRAHSDQNLVVQDLYSHDIHPKSNLNLSEEHFLSLLIIPCLSILLNLHNDHHISSKIHGGVLIIIELMQMALL